MVKARLDYCVLTTCTQVRFHLAEQEIKQIGEGESPAEYTRERAIQSFQQIVEIHGWQVSQLLRVLLRCTGKMRCPC